MDLTLTEEQARELSSLIDGALGELSHEIADTDNAHFRVSLVERRKRLSEVGDALRRGLQAAP
ncbi:MAG TPA: hypothetical protein VFN50_12140 [Acidimicrobiales bacterium]|nr:hypothetical protein [Acidimicrobiales bacterium]